LLDQFSDLSIGPILIRRHSLDFVLQRLQFHDTFIMLGCNFLLNLCHFITSIRLIRDPNQCTDSGKGLPDRIAPSRRRRRWDDRRGLNFVQASLCVGNWIGGVCRRRLCIARRPAIFSIR